MYVGIDVGGTKTLVAVMNNDGVILESRKFPTPKSYHIFLLELRHALAHMEHHDFKAAGIGIPAVVDRKHGRGIRFANLHLWRNVPVLSDIEKIIECPTVLENDAKLAGLSEAMLLKDKYERVVYVTISTGIGRAFINEGKIDTAVSDTGGRTMFFEHKGKLTSWESYASGHAIVERYGKRAEDIHDDATWKAIVRDLVPGFLEFIAVHEPDVIVIGGSVGTYFSRYHHFLADELKKYETPLIKMPVLRGAQRPEQAVVYGCYDLAKATFTHRRQPA